MQVAGLFTRTSINSFFFHEKCSDLDMRSTLGDELFELNDLGNSINELLNKFDFRESHSLLVGNIVPSSHCCTVFTRRTPAIQVVECTNVLQKKLVFEFTTALDDFRKVRKLNHHRCAKACTKIARTRT